MLILLQYFLKKTILQFKGKKRKKKTDWGIIKTKSTREPTTGYLLKGPSTGGPAAGNQLKGDQENHELDIFQF